MKIGIDARFYGGSFGKGLGRYTEKLLEYFDKINPPHEFIVFLRQENFDAFWPAHPEKFKKVLAPFHWYSYGEQILFPRLIKRQKVDLMHFPHFNVPIFSRTPFVVTIHDLIITHYPTIKATTLGPAAYALKQIGYHTVISHAIKKSRKIIAVSEFTKNDIIDSFGANPEKISVTYEAADAAVDLSKRESSEIVLEKFKIKQPYILYVGNAYPHKNIGGLIRAFKIIKDKNLSLVLVGKEDYFYRRVKKEAEKEDALAGVNFTGFVSDEELAALYRNARLYCFPSFYEGFGLPPLEAMTYGVPVVSSDRSCLPEILKDSAEYFNPDDLDQTAKILYDISSNEIRRADLIKKGYEQVKKYSWEQCARETLRVYEEIL